MGCTVSADTELASEDIGVQGGNAWCPGSAEVHTEVPAAERQTFSATASDASADGGAQPGGVCSPSPWERALARGDFSVHLHRRPTDVLGATLGNTGKGAVILSIQKCGLLDKWNQANSRQALYPGLIIVEVNGFTGYWPILEELQRPGALAMTVTATPPRHVGPSWFEEIAKMGRGLEGQSGKNSFMLRLQPQDPQAENYAFSSLPSVRAGEAGAEQCAICLQDVRADEYLVQLPCRHAFHSLCAARWLMQPAKQTKGKRQCCPLCCRRLVGTADGGVRMAEEAEQ